MKKAFLLIVACTFAVFSAYAQDSEVERVNQLTKAEQFKANNSFVKETTIFTEKNSGMRLYAKLFTNLNNGEQIAALEIWPTVGSKLLTGGIVTPLGYLDMDQIDDLLLALETIVAETSKTSKKESYTITYTAPGGIDVIYIDDITTGALGTTGLVVFRKKWYQTNDYGVQTVNFSDATTSCSIKNLPKLIESIKEAQVIAQQALTK